MAKPFNLEDAKNGARIEFERHENIWLPCSFVGLDRNGCPVVQLKDGQLFIIADEDDLRMETQRRDIYVVARPGQDAGVWFADKDAAAYAKVFDSDVVFVLTITE